MACKGLLLIDEPIYDLLSIGVFGITLDVFELPIATERFV
jgi:hypothetical protein